MGASSPKVRLAILLALIGVLLGVTVVWAALSKDPAHPGAVYVDVNSVGGKCDDGRAAKEVTRAAPWCSLANAARAAPDGSTILVRRGRYPALSIRGEKRRRHVTFRPFASERVVVNGLTVDSSRGFRFRGLRITDVTHMEGVAQIQLLRNDISPHGVVASGRDLRFERNRIHDLTIRFEPGTPGPRCNRLSSEAGIPPRCGFGFRLNNMSNVVIRDNLLSRIPADGIQMGGIRNALIEGNHFKYISAFVDPAEHSDGIQILGRNDHVVIRRNLFDHVRGIIALAYSGRVAPGHPRGLTIEDNVLVQLHHFAMVLLDTEGLRLTHNTVWDGATGVALRNGTGNAVVAHNILNRFEASPDMLSVEDHNLIASGYRSGPHDTARRPRFVAPGKLDYRLKPGSPGAGKRVPSLGARGLPAPR